MMLIPPLSLLHFHQAPPQSLEPPAPRRHRVPMLRISFVTATLGLAVLRPVVYLSAASEAPRRPPIAATDATQVPPTESTCQPSADTPGQPNSGSGLLQD